MEQTPFVKNRRLLVIDDQEAIHQDFRKILLPNSAQSDLTAVEGVLFGNPQPERRLHFKVDSALQGEEGLVRVQQALREGHPYALAFIDARMPPGWDGIVTTEKLWAADPDLQVVICTAFPDYSLPQIIGKLGISDQLLILKKPFDPIEVLQLACALTKKWHLLQTARGKMADLEQAVADRNWQLNATNEKLRTEVEERKRFAEALRTTQDRLNYLLTNSPVVMYSLRICKTSLVPAWASQSVAEVFGCTAEEWRRVSWEEEHLHPEDKGQVQTARAALFEIGSCHHEYRLRHADGTYRWVREQAKLLRNRSGAPEEVVGVYVDVTDRKLLEQKLLEGRKMEAIGQFAGGVAHDFNNLLTIISSYSCLLLEAESLPAELTEPIKQIIGASERAAELTRQLLAYGRRQVMRPQLLSLDEAIANLAKMLGRILGEDIALEIQSSHPNLKIHADNNLLDQVLLNLAANARDAMPRGGRLLIRTSAVQVRPDYRQRCPEARSGAFACLSVRDSGSGIAPEVLPHIFEPFFTTKDIGKGTGLGLPTVHGIIQLHQGWIEVESEPGQGTTFNLLLPAVADSVEMAPEALPEATVTGGTEVILFVEDEPALLRLGRTVLERHGYRVLEAKSGVAALEIWEQHGTEVDILVTDMVMPEGVSGCHLADTLRRAHPELKVLFMSGYSPELLQDKGSHEGTEFLSKPYDPAALLSAIRRALDNNPPSALPATKVRRLAQPDSQ